MCQSGLDYPKRNTFKKPRDTKRLSHSGRRASGWAVSYWGSCFSLGKLPRETRKPGRTAQKRGSLHPWEWEAPPQHWNRDKGYTPTWLKGEKGSVWWESVFSPVSKYLDIALKKLVVGTMYFKRREWSYSIIPKNKQALGSNRLGLSSGSSSPAHLWFNLGKFH